MFRKPQKIKKKNWGPRQPYGGPILITISENDNLNHWKLIMGQQTLPLSPCLASHTLFFKLQGSWLYGNHAYMRPKNPWVGPLFRYKFSIHPQVSRINMEPPTPSHPSPPTPNLTERQIQILEALHEHAYETMDIEYPWYLLWNECFTQLNNLFSDKDVHLAVGPQQQFFIRKHRLLILNSRTFP